MRFIIAAIGALALVSTAANAAPVNKYTITGYAASSAVQRGVPLDQRPERRSLVPGAGQEQVFVGSGVNKINVRRVRHCLNPNQSASENGLGKPHATLRIFSEAKRAVIMSQLLKLSFFSS